MKLAFAVLSLGVVAAAADFGFRSAGDAVYKHSAEVDQVAREAARELQHQLDVIAAEPTFEVDDALSDIAALKTVSEECWAQQQAALDDILSGLEGGINDCTAAAARPAVDVVSSVSTATQQVVFGGSDLVRSRRRCQRTQNEIRKRICRAKLSVKAAKYTVDTLKSEEDVRRSAKEAAAAVGADGRRCVRGATSRAARELRRLGDQISDCARARTSPRDDPQLEVNSL